MPTSGKLFTFRDTVDVKEAKKLIEETSETEIIEGLELEYRYEHLSLNVEETELYGTHTRDITHKYDYRGQAQIVPETIYTPFRFFTQEDTQYLFIWQGQSLANKIALEISHAIEQDVYEVRLNNKKMREWVEAQKKTILSFFEDLELVNANKAALYAGKDGNVAQTDLWGMYLNNGAPGYLLAKTEDDYTVGLGTSGGVVIFNQINQAELLTFVQERIIKLTLERRDQ